MLSPHSDSDVIKFLLNPIKQSRMKDSFTIMRSIKHRSKSAFTTNMFREPDPIEEQNIKVRENAETYDFVGPAEFRTKLISKNTISAKMQLKDRHNDQLTPFNQTYTSKNQMNTTINRENMLSTLHQDQVIELTKHTKNLKRFKEYQDVWERKKLSIKKEIHKKTPILMDSNIKSLYVHPNRDKTDIINNHVVHYWEMSLRNNNPILEGHIKGYRFQKVEKEKLLQLRSGTRKVESSIPMLPIDKIAGLKRRELSLNGRNKVKKQLETEIEKTQTRLSLGSSMKVNQEEVFKISYEGAKRWMGAENL